MANWSSQLQELSCKNCLQPEGFVFHAFIKISEINNLKKSHWGKIREICMVMENIVSLTKLIQ